MGPYSVSGECIESGGGTRTVVLEQGPGATVDGFAIEDTAARAISVLSNPAHSTQETEAYHLFLDPSSGSPVETTITLSAIGVTTNTCHVSVVAIPTS